MAIITAKRKAPPKRTPVTAARQPVQSNNSITSGVRSRSSSQKVAASFATLTPSQQAFARQLQANCRKHSAIMGATNTTNIAARPDFIELLPLFVQKLLILDVFGSVAMKSRQQIIPYFKVIASNDKGETKAGDVFNTPFVNRQGLDGNFTGRAVKNELVAAEGGFSTGSVMYVPVLPGSVTINANISGVSTVYTDDAAGTILGADGAEVGQIQYDTGTITMTTPIDTDIGDSVKATYSYDNETVGPNVNGEYGAMMGKIYLQLDEFNLVAEAHELASYWSIFSAFAASQEWGSNIGDMAKEAAFAELTAEINTNGFRQLEKAATYNPQYNWDAGPVLSGSVVPSDYLNMFKLKLGQAAASIYQATRLTRPNRLTMGANVAEYMKMMNGFSVNSTEDTVGPYKLGTLDHFECYVEPSYDPNKWVMSCKSTDIRKNSGLFGEYMPFTSTDAIGLANMSIQQGYATMYAMKVVNPLTVVSGKIVGVF
jgi:hypothetical protein